MNTTAEASPEKEPMKKGAQILCVGNEMRLLSTRCEVLKYSGYSAQAAMVKDAADLINKEAFDLIIVSAFLSDADQQGVLSAAIGTPTLVLHGLAIARELLAAVEGKLSSRQVVRPSSEARLSRTSGCTGFARISKT
jgi:CheY-like chemotaxis protein